MCVSRKIVAPKYQAKDVVLSTGILPSVDFSVGFGPG